VPAPGPKIRPRVRTPLAAGATDEAHLDVGQSDTVTPSIGTDRERVAALVIGAVDQDTGQAIERSSPKVILAGRVICFWFYLQEPRFRLDQRRSPREETAAMLRRYCGNQCPKNVLIAPWGIPIKQARHLMAGLFILNRDAD